MDLRYRLFLNPQSTVPVATFIIQAYAEKFAKDFNHVDLWVIRDERQEGLIVARNLTVPPRGRGVPPG